MVLTKKDIENLQTGNGGYNKKTLALLGLKWPPKKGWKNKVIGKEVDDKKYFELLNSKSLNTF